MKMQMKRIIHYILLAIVSVLINSISYAGDSLDLHFGYTERYLENSIHYFNEREHLNTSLQNQKQSDATDYVLDLSDKFGKVSLLTKEEKLSLNAQLKYLNELKDEKGNLIGKFYIAVHAPFPEAEGTSRKSTYDSIALFNDRFISGVESNENVVFFNITTLIDKTGSKTSIVPGFSYGKVLYALGKEYLTAQSAFPLTACAECKGVYATANWMFKGLSNNTTLTANYAQSLYTEKIEEEPAILNGQNPPITIRFIPDQTIKYKKGEKYYLKDYYQLLLQSTFMTTVFNNYNENNQSDIVEKWYSSHSWVSDGDFAKGKANDVTFGYTNIYNKLSHYPIVLQKYVEVYIYDPYKDYPFIKYEILDNYKPNFSYNLDQIMSIASIAKAMGEELWDSYHSISGNTINLINNTTLEAYYNNLKKYYENSSQFKLYERVRLCKTPGTDGASPEGMTFILRKFNESDYTNLSTELRYHILEVFSKGSINQKVVVSGLDNIFPLTNYGEEEIMVKLFSSANDQSKVELFNRLRDNKKLFKKLYDGIDGSNCDLWIDQLAIAFAIQFDFSKTPPKEYFYIVKPAETQGAYGDDGYIKLWSFFPKGNGFATQIIDITPETYLEPFDPIGIAVAQDSENPEDNIIYLPSIYLYQMVQNKEQAQTVKNALELLNFIGISRSVNILIKGTTGIVRYIAYAEVVNFSLNRVFQNEAFRATIIANQGEDKLGEKFLAAWPYVSASIDLFTIGADLSPHFQNYTDGYTKFKNVIDDLPQAEQKQLSKLNEQCQEILDVGKDVAGMQKLLARIDKLNLTDLKVKINSFESDFIKNKFLDDFTGASDDALKKLNEKLALVDFWKSNGNLYKSKTYPNVGHKNWDIAKDEIISKAEPSELKVLNAIEGAKQPSNSQVAIAGAYSPELGGDVVLKYNDKNFNLNSLEPELKQHLDYLQLIKDDFDKGGKLYEKLYTNVPLEKIQNAGEAGKHAEVLATNEVLKQLKSSGKFNSIQDLNKIYVLVKGRPSFGNMCRCPHCFQIIDGVKMIGNQ
jgi:hypothetical protein